MVLFIQSCGKSGVTKSSQETQNVSAIYSSSQLNIKVYYETGAEPYTDTAGTANKSLWDVFETNLKALFSGRPTVISVPKKLDQMIKLKDYNKSTWSVEDVKNLSDDYSLTAQAGTTNFQIFFVNGYASESQNIIGFHISNTQVMVIFKDVIRSSSTGSGELVPKYVEQATLVHEMGHALGLVNNGLPMKSQHHDQEHRAHCSNENCVMYYANEGTSSLLKYITKIMTDNNLVMFDQQCLNDAVNYKK